MRTLIEFLICGTIGAYCVMRCAALMFGSSRNYTGATIPVPTAAFPNS